MKHQFTLSKKIGLLFSLFTFVSQLHAQNVGVGNASPASKVDIKGNLTVGSTYSGTAAPASGAIIEGNVGIGTSAPAQQLHVVGTERVSTLGGNSNVGNPNAFVTSDANGDMGRVNATFPGALGGLELWYRPTGAPYIEPVSNSNIRVYDVAPTQPYGIYYDGASNTVGGYFRTTSVTSGTAAVEGFSDVTGNQTWGYIGWVGTYNFGVPAQSISGMAVYGQVDDPSRTAGFFRTTTNATVAAIIAYSDVWIPAYNYVDNNYAALYDPMASYNQLNINNATLPGSVGLFTADLSYSYRGTLAAAATMTTNVGTRGQAISQNGWALGIMGNAWSNAANAVGSGGYDFGGYFDGNKYSGANLDYAYVGGQFNGVAYKITGGGTTAEIVPTPSHGRITLMCPEAPEYWYQDYGTVQLENGHAHVNLDPILADIIVVDAQNPIRVFCQVNIPDGNDVAVINKTATGFDLVEKNGGTHSGEVDYTIIAKPKTNFGSGRFPQAPAPAWLANHDSPLAKAANQPVNVWNWPRDSEVYGVPVPKNYIQTPANDKNSAQR